METEHRQLWMFKAYCARASELAAVNQSFLIHEAMNGCKNLKIH